MGTSDGPSAECGEVQQGTTKDNDAVFQEEGVEEEWQEPKDFEGHVWTEIRKKGFVSLLLNFLTQTIIIRLGETHRNRIRRVLLVRTFDGSPFFGKISHR